MQNIGEFVSPVIETGVSKGPKQLSRQKLLELWGYCERLVDSCLAL